MIIIKIATEFSNTPGGRFIKEGPNSGEEFRDKLLEPKYIDAKANNDKIAIANGIPVFLLDKSIAFLEFLLR